MGDPETVEPDPQAPPMPAVGQVVSLEFVVAQVFPEWGTVQLVRRAPLRGEAAQGPYATSATIGVLPQDCWWMDPKTTPQELLAKLLVLLPILIDPGTGRGHATGRGEGVDAGAP
jgi:hypothetical protein